MRLLVVSQYFWPENFRINDFVAEMVTRGHQVTVLTGIPNYPEGTVNPDFLREPEKFREWSGAEIIRVPIFVRGQGPLRLWLQGGEGSFQTVGRFHLGFRRSNRKGTRKRNHKRISRRLWKSCGRLLRWTWREDERLN